MGATYWVFMGAAAITVHAGARLLDLPDAERLLPHQAVVSTMVVLWAFATWLVPLLLALGAWRHVLRRVPLRYEAGLWSLVFPVGMYGVACHDLGHATATPWLSALAAAEGWVAAAVWVAVFAAMAVSQLRTAPRHDGAA
jgi:tellurite resistance protein TehA-like permease